MSPAKTTEPVEMPFGCGILSAQRTILDGAADPPMGRGNFDETGRPTVKYRDYYPLGPESAEFLVSRYRDKVRDDIAISSPSVRLNHQLNHQLRY